MYCFVVLSSGSNVGWRGILQSRFLHLPFRGWDVPLEIVTCSCSPRLLSGLSHVHGGKIGKRLVMIPWNVFFQVPLSGLFLHYYCYCCCCLTAWQQPGPRHPPKTCSGVTTLWLLLHWNISTGSTKRLLKNSYGYIISFQVFLEYRQQKNWEFLNGCS